MLGSLARKLRALGLDTAYLAPGDDAGAVALCRRQGRVLVTADAQLVLFARARGVEAVAVRGRSDAARIAELAAAARGAGIRLTRGDSRCSLCNGPLASLGRADVEGEVAPAIAARHRAFSCCTLCGHLYWKGTHWKKLRSLGRLLDRS
jgi:hypothetical protein